MTILITGGNGFVGQNLIKKLSQKKANKIIVLCRKKHKHLYFNIHKVKNLEVIYKADITNLKTIIKHFRGVDVVFNLAGFVSYKNADKKELIKINYSGALNVLKACKHHKVKKLIHLSSSAALGFSKQLIDEEFRFDWSKHKRLNYSYSKHLAEAKLLSSDICVVVVSPPMIIGGGDEKILPLVKIISEGKLKAIPEGRNSFVDVRDLADAMMFLMNKKMASGRVLVAGGNHTNMELAEAIATKLQTSPPKFVIPKFFGRLICKIAIFIEAVFPNGKLNYENVFLSFLDRRHSTKNIKKLGFCPKYSLDGSVSECVDYLKRISLK